MKHLTIAVIISLLLSSNLHASPNFLPSKWTTGNLIITGITGYLGYTAWTYQNRWETTHKSLLTENGCNKYAALEMDKYCQVIHDLTGEGDEDAERVPLYAASAIMFAVVSYTVWNTYWATVTKKKKYSKIQFSATRDSATVFLKLDF
tara:strand:- start:7237 stop:7680 length:444 start_codon:yes stop_codon:yes gene_type:complete